MIPFQPLQTIPSPLICSLLTAKRSSLLSLSAGWLYLLSLVECGLHIMCCYTINLISALRTSQGSNINEYTAVKYGTQMVKETMVPVKFTLTGGHSEVLLI